MFYKNEDKCRISGSKEITKILDLGNQPLANSLKNNRNSIEKKIPLSLYFCKKTSNIQINETVNKKILFDRYIWVTGTSDLAKKYANIFFNKTKILCKLKKDDFIIEIASNDGTFLKPFLKKNFNNILGVDPAKNISKIATENKIKNLNKFWNFETSKIIKKKYGKSKLVFARNVIPHVSDLQSVIKGIHNILEKDGIGIVEFHYASKIFKGLQYDSIYHEHLNYFTLKSFEYLLKIHKLYAFDIIISPMSGGSLAVCFSKQKRKKNIDYLKLKDKEKKTKLNSLTSWKQFGDRVYNHRKKTLLLLKKFNEKKIIGFGSSARSQTYLNFCQVTKNQISAIIDNNKMKQGKFAPGSSIPIISLKKGLLLKPDIIFILAWNFEKEIINICKKNGYTGKFIIPFPNSPKIKS